MAMLRNMFGDEQYDQLEQASNQTEEFGVDWEMCRAVGLALLGLATVAGDTYRCQSWRAYP